MTYWWPAQMLPLGQRNDVKSIKVSQPAGGRVKRMGVPSWLVQARPQPVNRCSLFASADMQENQINHNQHVCQNAQCLTMQVLAQLRNRFCNPFPHSSTCFLALTILHRQSNTSRLSSQKTGCWKFLSITCTKTKRGLHSVECTCYCSESETMERTTLKTSHDWIRPLGPSALLICVYSGHASSVY